MISWIELEPLLCQVGILAILAISLNFMCGVTGLLQLGHAGFYAIGAYTAGLYSIYGTQPDWGWFNLIPAIGCGMSAAVLFALFIGAPCLRLRGDYLAVTTLAFGEIVRLLLTNLAFPGGPMFPGETIGGPTGIAFTEFPEDRWPDAVGYSAEYATLPVILVLVLITYVLLRNIKLSSVGRALMCIREDEIAARSMGVKVPRFKMIAFAVSAAFAGLAGALFFHHQLRINPSDFDLLKSVEVLLIVVLGGMGSLSGSIVAAILLGLLPTLLRHIDLSDVEWLPDLLQRPLSEFTMLFYAILLIVLIRLLPSGLLGMHEWRGRRRAPQQPGAHHG